jgi:hypothetical protein
MHLIALVAKTKIRITLSGKKSLNKPIIEEDCSKILKNKLAVVIMLLCYVAFSGITNKCKEY